MLNYRREAIAAALQEAPRHPAPSGSVRHGVARCPCVRCQIGLGRRSVERGMLCALLCTLVWLYISKTEVGSVVSGPEAYWRRIRTP